MNNRRTTSALLAVLAFALASCGSDDEPAAEPAGPTTGPSSISASDQSGDGGSVIIDAVELPTAGFVVVHAEADGGPGPILGWSDLLPAGSTTDVTVDLDTVIVESATVYPMAHVDANDNGVYEFTPPDVTIDVPATTAEGSVAVLPIAYTVAGAGDAVTPKGLVLVETELGSVLGDENGRVLYLFTPDGQGDSTCYGDCEAAWPVFGEAASVGDGLDPALVGTTTRTDGAIQATYNGWPLYYFASDVLPGDTNGQAVGDVWWVVDAAGAAVGL